MKRWYDDWEITHEKDRIIVDVPNSHTAGRVVFTGESMENASIKWLIDIVDCALTELTKDETTRKETKRQSR